MRVTSDDILVFYFPQNFSFLYDILYVSFFHMVDRDFLLDVNIIIPERHNFIDSPIGPLAKFLQNFVLALGAPHRVLVG
jgi:hypothetical protein